MASPRAPSASTSGDGDDEDPRVFTIGEDGEFVALDAARTSSEDRARDAPGDDDDWALDSAVEVIRGPDGDVLFRFTGDAEEHYNAAVAFASEEDARAEPEPEPEPTPAQRAQALLDEAQALIEEAKRIRAEDEVAVAAAAKRAAETIAPDTEGTRIMRRPARSVTPARPDASALGGLAAASKLGIKSIVDGIEGMFSNFRRKADASTRPSVRIPTAPKDSPWKEHPGDAPPASALDAAFDAFATDAAAAETDAIVVDADSEDAAMAEEMEEEHAEWEDAAARAMISGNVSSVASEPEEEAPESALERYESMGSVVAGMWRPKPLDVTINGREFIAYITPNNIQQLPSGEYVVGDEDDDVVGDRVGETHDHHHVRTPGGRDERVHVRSHPNRASRQERPLPLSQRGDPGMSRTEETGRRIRTPKVTDARRDANESTESRVKNVSLFFHPTHSAARRAGASACATSTTSLI